MIVSACPTSLTIACATVYEEEVALGSRNASSRSAAKEVDESYHMLNISSCELGQSFTHTALKSVNSNPEVHHNCSVKDKVDATRPQEEAGQQDMFEAWCPKAWGDV